jgi:hypothetical protein
MTAMTWICETYGVPAKKGARVEYTGGPAPEFGTITGAAGAHLSIRLDGKKHTLPFHPTWKLRFSTPPLKGPDNERS